MRLVKLPDCRGCMAACHGIGIPSVAYAVSALPPFSLLHRRPSVILAESDQNQASPQLLENQFVDYQKIPSHMFKRNGLPTGMMHSMLASTNKFPLPQLL